MNKIKLALLCTPCFFALMLSQVNPAFARKLTPMELAAPQLNSSEIPAVNTPTINKSSEIPSITSTETIKQIAMSKFGCDCPSCQAMVSNMILQGNLPQPQ